MQTGRILRPQSYIRVQLLYVSLYTNTYSQQVGSSKGYAGFRNRRRLQVFTRLIPVTANDDVLEIGPNKGLLLDAFKSRARSVTGVDINEEAVKQLNRPDILCMDATNLLFPNNSFTVVVGIEVFEHIPALQEAFSEVARVLAGGGKCYLTVPFELFRGQQALGDAWHNYRDLRMARKLHVHLLNPGKIRKMIAPTPLKMITSKLIWIPGPSYFMILQKDK
jgi:SAM-dependent methyltransferase